MSKKKNDILVEMMSRPQGATCEELAEATGWQTTSVNSVMSRHIRPKWPVIKRSVDGKARYFIESDEAI